ncbi:hypothetical protein NEUTE1DRAFT_115994 [Neurospora tetrasperma FGSC 2508]|uniref:Uncharacterized protein n=1 Tax=Neurospora tetrasperma (strain FGSC 2508 / ATCC MYA-4615 / P0657) TaxID=510951 RepID=F8MBM1_NEUT8|nr:uncharacterized protein NEUTE1DRAFT_115994 [Neurospora tetrasperma FGSC 2508]EGO61133.1 hypothetical protein NEUTE1DRAFT_115994 [Neurospora tetrasperma FGSC 2508]EGZ74862.1 hypothetical protein NEUTE2DRAFT_143489 [Neurospora tetrasperma FGSC 2509]
MNTVKSFWLGWGSLCVGGAAAYYFAKKEINASRRNQLEELRRKKSMVSSMEQSENLQSQSLSSSATGGSATYNGSPARTDSAGSPSMESSNDPAPTRHAPSTERERVFEKSKYEASVPYSSRKGDRFS